MLSSEVVSDSLYLWQQLCGSTFWMFVPIPFFNYDLQAQEKNTKIHLN